jgi:stage III sporulation protein AG
LIAGVALMLIPSSGQETTPIEENKTITSFEYCTLLEQKAKSLICELPEIDGCEVFITLEKGYRYIYATDQHVKESGENKETDKTIVLAQGDGREEPILIEETMPCVAGVAVVCKGANYQTQYRIIELMCALFDIKSNRISIQT